MAIDSKGNAWVTNTMGSGLTLETKLRLLVLKLRGATLSAIDQVALQDLLAHPGLGKRVDVAPRRQPRTGIAVQSAAASGVHGRCRSTATTMPGFPTSRQVAASLSFAAPGLKLVRLA